METKKRLFSLICSFSKSSCLQCSSAGLSLSSRWLLLLLAGAFAAVVLVCCLLSTKFPGINLRAKKKKLEKSKMLELQLAE